MNNRRINTQTQAIALIVNELRRRLPKALAHAADITPDGYASGHTGTGTRSGISDPVANTVTRRDQLGTIPALTNLERTLTNAAVQLADALAIIDKLSPPPGASPRCYGGHLPGASIPIDDGGWWRPCDNIPDGRPAYQGLCNACFQKHRRWVKQQQQREP